MWDIVDLPANGCGAVAPSWPQFGAPEYSLRLRLCFGESAIAELVTVKPKAGDRRSVELPESSAAQQCANEKIGIRTVAQRFIKATELVEKGASVDCCLLRKAHSPQSEQWQKFCRRGG